MARTVPATRAFLVDSLALVTFFTCTGILNERFIAGMDWSEVATSRLIGAPLMILVARPYGLWRDWLLDRVDPRSPSACLLWDGFCLLIFQVPIYLAIIAAGGATGPELWRGAVGAAAMMLCLGRPYGLYLDWMRGVFGLPPGGDKPMSLKDD